LQTLPSTVGNLLDLQTLILNRNKLTILPLTIGAVPGRWFPPFAFLDTAERAQPARS
jgi:Leucine-rich repeat (LRR) protein